MHFHSWLTCLFTPACCFLLLTSSDTWILRSPFITWKNIQKFLKLQFRKKFNQQRPATKYLHSREDSLEVICNIPLLYSPQSWIKTCLFVLVPGSEQNWILKCIKNWMKASCIHCIIILTNPSHQGGRDSLLICCTPCLSLAHVLSTTAGNETKCSNWLPPHESPKPHLWMSLSQDPEYWSSV